MLIFNLKDLKTKEYYVENIKIKGLSIGKFDAKLRAECPEIYENLKKFSDDCSSYLSFIEEHDIIKDIERYITINSLNE